MKQSTYETCLACCLLDEVERIKKVKATKKLEFECLMHSLKFTREDFISGHLDFITKKFKVAIQLTVDNFAYANYLHKLTPHAKTKATAHKITLNLINEHIDENPIICFDWYYPNGIYHYPHYVTVLSKIGRNYKVYDVWYGKEKIMSAKLLAKGISSLRNHLKMAPQMIIVEPKKQ